MKSGRIRSGGKSSGKLLAIAAVSVATLGVSYESHAGLISWLKSWCEKAPAAQEEPKPEAPKKSRNAAGVVVYSQFGTRHPVFYVLLGQERKVPQGKTEGEWTFFKGAIEEDENELVAARGELFEETARVYDVEERVIANSPYVDYLSPSRGNTVRAYFTLLPFIPANDIREAKNEIMRKGNEESHVFKEIKDYVWVKADDLIAAISKGESLIKSTTPGKHGREVEIQLSSYTFVVLQHAYDQGKGILNFIK